ncbi:MAG: lipid-A-disaccharide synthase, partial [Pseudomonadota bacterium]
MKAFVIAGEPSGDALGAALIDGLRATGPLTVTGIGGPMMASAGMPSLFPMDDLS